MDDVHDPLGNRTLDARLFPAGRIEPVAGGAFPAPATWQVQRCRPHGPDTLCLLKAAIRHQTWFTTVPESTLQTDELKEAGVKVQLERFARPV